MNDNRQRYGQHAPPRATDPSDGVLVVDKPAGPTSHDIVDAIRKHFRIRKVGHGGTLDPQATGVLLLLLGKGTKLSNRFLTEDKVYEGMMHLGVTTDSHDADGKTLTETDASGVTREQVEAELRRMTGDLMQTPPMVSAVKIGGVPLYKRARKGETVEREARLIHVYEFTLEGFHHPEVDFRVRCTKGTYVRTLCHDIGKSLGCGAHLAALRRTQCGDIHVKDAIRMETIMEMSLAELQAHILPIHRFAATPRPPD